MSRDEIMNLIRIQADSEDDPELFYRDIEDLCGISADALAEFDELMNEIEEV